MGRRAVWTGLVVALAVTVGVALSVKPWHLYLEQREKTDMAKAEMRDAERERAELMRQRARYESPVGREELARERGYRKPDERPLNEAR